MRRKALEHRDAGWATAVALVMVLIYAFWGASLLHSHKQGAVAANQQQSLAIK